MKHQFQNNLTKGPGRPRIREMNASPIGVRIKTARDAKGWSLSYLAELCGKSPQTINAIELGVSQSPQLGTIMPILNALDLSVAEAVAL